MSWTYSQTSGILTSPDKKTWQCYAGNGVAKNNPAMQDQHNHGPLPRGLYKFEKPEQGTHLGPNAIPLTPDAKNQMFGRGSFFVHADSIKHPGEASEGCIVAPSAARIAIILSNDKTLQVNV